MLANFQNFGGLPYGASDVTPSPAPSGEVSHGPTRDVTAMFQGGEFKGTAHQVRITRGDKTFEVDVIMPKEQDACAHLPKLKTLEDSLRRLNDDQLQRLERLVVDPSEGPGNRGGGMYTQGDDGQVNISPSDGPEEAEFRYRPGELAEILTHEDGHFASIKPWGQDTTSPPWQAYRQAAKKDRLGISQYGNTNLTEDFAEAWALYRGSRHDPKTMDALRKLYPNRFALLDDMMARQKRKKAA